MIEIASVPYRDVILGIQMGSNMINTIRALEIIRGLADWVNCVK